LVRGAEREVAEVNWLASLRIAMVSVVVSIRMRKMFAEVRKMFLYARDAEQDVRERQASKNF
jgi:hypothetical protein